MPSVQKLPLMKLMEELKLHSSKWIKTKEDKLKDFYWQDGCGTFSVYSQQIDSIKNYIENQHEPHEEKIFQDEYRLLMKEHHIDIDERYVWE